MHLPRAHAQVVSRVRVGEILVLQGNFGFGCRFFIAKTYRVVSIACTPASFTRALKSSITVAIFGREGLGSTTDDDAGSDLWARDLQRRASRRAVPHGTSPK